ncbi:MULTISPECIES: hypothetical protein, partial [Pantoea]|uniref:hypothetical protein n=1 Tax=Pantoea sp. YR525 TaxID=1884372 RepID=UPI001C316C8E
MSVKRSATFVRHVLRQLQHLRAATEQRASGCTEPQNLDTFYISFDARYSTGLMPVLRQIR